MLVVYRQFLSCLGQAAELIKSIKSHISTKYWGHKLKKTHKSHENHSISNILTEKIVTSNGKNYTNKL